VIVHAAWLYTRQLPALRSGDPDLGHWTYQHDNADRLMTKTTRYGTDSAKGRFGKNGRR
jgi:hypothetical protein